MSLIIKTQQDIIDLLAMQKAKVIQAIRSYPPPIPACDAQFNYLLEQRDYLVVEMNRLNQEGIETSQLLDLVEKSQYINEDDKQAFRQQLE